MVEGSFWILLALWLLLFPLRWTAGVLLAAGTHELGHLLAIWLTGGKIRSFRLSAAGGNITTDPMGRWQELVCLLAGPLAGGLVILMKDWFPEAALAALLQTAFNLLPVYPLDGGRILRNICCKRDDVGL